MKTIKHILLIAILLMHFAARASECYHYHTLTGVELIHEAGETYLRLSVIDPNGVSVASQKRYRIPGASPHLKLTDVAGDGDSYFRVVEDEERYYFADIRYPEEPIELLPIVEKKRVSSFFNARVACIDGRWMQLIPNSYDKRVAKKEIKNFPQGAEVLAGYRHRSYILKDDQHLYTFDVTTGDVSVLDAVNVRSLQFISPPTGEEGTYFYTDGQRFWSVELPWFEIQEVTEDLTGLGLSPPFHVDGIHALHFQNVVTIQGKFLVHNGSGFYALPDTRWYEEKHTLLERNGKVYLDPWEAYHNHPGIDLSGVAAASELREAQYDYYTDGRHHYYYNADLRKMVKMTGFDADFAFTRGVFSYMHNTSNFFDNGKQLVYTNPNEHRITSRIPHATPLKNLKVAYAFDDKLLIEDTVITHRADNRTLSFVGSTVDIISPCDGGDGQIPVEIEYHYFFKDKNKVYAYHTGDALLRVVPGVSPSSLANSGYNDWLQLKADKK